MKPENILIVATNNAHKLAEIQSIMDKRVLLRTLADIGFEGDIPEDYETLEENATQKALFIFNKYGKSCFADDTGLEIDALQGAPGVYSARFAGNQCNYDDNVNLVLEKLKGCDNRKAKFRTVIALAIQGKVTLFEGTIHGSITHERRGNQGFGYDPIFIPDGHALTFAEMSAQEKNRISHRARALEKFSKFELFNHC
jgi:XTP/dITP diphosphohydrolase